MIITEHFQAINFLLKHISSYYLSYKKWYNDKLDLL